MTMESHVVLCRQCHRTRVVAVSDLRSPCFRNIEEQAECPEILQRRESGDETLLTMMCGALAGSFAENLQHAVVEVVDREGEWQIACRIPGDSDRFYSSTHARWQGEIWGRCGRTGLARRFRDAADEADQASRSRRRMRRLVPILALGLVIAAVGAARTLLTWSNRQPTEIAMQGQVSWAEQQSVAVAGIAGTEAPAPRLPAAEPPNPQLAVLEPTASPSPEAVSSAPETPSNPSAAALVSTAPAAINDAATSQSAPPPEPLAAPEMVSLPGGPLTMGSNLDPTEAPIHSVTVKPFAISKAVVTVRTWSQCVAARACPYVATEENEDAPVTNVSFNDAQQFVAWLSRETRMSFRLPTEAEWEYAARGGTRTKYWWGDELQPGMVNCKGCNSNQAARQISKAEDFKPNPFGLYDMGGNVAQWVSDCWHKNYQGAVADGSAWVDADYCFFHVIRSGAWRNDPKYVRPASRDYYDGRIRYPTHGFRIARSL